MSPSQDNHSKHLSIMHRDGNTCHHWPWYEIGHMSVVLAMIQAQCECRHRLLLTVRLWNPSVSGHDWLTEGNQWSETWFGVKRSAWMRSCVWIWRVACWIMYYSLWCLCASQWELVQRARFESELLDRMDRLDMEQVSHDGKKKSVNVVTNQKDSCDVTSYPYAIPAFRTIMLKWKNTGTAISRS